MDTSLPSISPVVDQTSRPVWSVMIPTYNCADYLRVTLESVLAQDPGPEQMQIEVVDDCSTKDDPQAVVQEVGRGRVQFYRQPQNGGAIANFNTCIQRSVGQIVHILHGDDFVKDGFYQHLEKPLLERNSVGAACCRQIYVDEQGKYRLTTRLEQPTSGLFTNALDVLAVSNRIQPPAMVVKRCVYEALGGYASQLFHSADWEMWVRIAARYQIWYEIEPLAVYRVHAASDTSKLYLTGANVQDRRRCINFFQAHLPPDRAKNLTRKALGYSALYAANTALKALKSGQRRLSLVQLQEASRCLLNLLQVKTG